MLKLFFIIFFGKITPFLRFFRFVNRSFLTMRAPCVWWISWKHSGWSNHGPLLFTWSYFPIIDSIFFLFFSRIFPEKRKKGKKSQLFSFFPFFGKKGKKEKNSPGKKEKGKKGKKMKRKKYEQWLITLNHNHIKSIIDRGWKIWIEINRKIWKIKCRQSK